jgi:chemotaxis protein MotB
MADGEQPIIIKKIKKGGHGHHGGAWKVAYADFVTAMMAFFLLLWLLSSTPQEKLTGIAEYFTPTVGVRDEMGIGFEGGETIHEDGSKKSDLAPPGIVLGSAPTGVIPTEGAADSQFDEGEEQQKFDSVAEEIKQAFEQDAGLAQLKEHVIIDQTPEGLRIQIVDQNNRSMFASGSANLEPHAKIIISKISEIIKNMPNNLSVAGHTDSAAFNRGGYTNWELSADRANSTRRFMLSVGTPERRFDRVQGKADKEPLDGEDPKSERNRRISIILLKGSLSPYDVPAPDELLQVPTGSDPKYKMNLESKGL